jgi:hypothetical protein
MGLTLLLLCVVVGCMATETRQTLMQKVGGAKKKRKKKEEEKHDISFVVGLT